MADRKVNPDLKLKQSKWGWPHLAPVHDKTSGTQSSERPSSLRSVSGASQKLPGLNEQKTPSQTTLPLSPITSDTGSIKSTKLADAPDVRVGQHFGDIPKPSSLSSRSSWSASSGHGTIRPEEPQTEQISQKAEEPLLEENVPAGEEPSSGIDIQNSDDQHPREKLPTAEVSNSEKLPREKELGPDAEIQTSHDPQLEEKMPLKKDMDSAGEVQRDHDLHVRWKQPSVEELSPEGGVQRGYDSHLETKLQEAKESSSGQLRPREKDTDPEGEQQRENDLHVRWKQPSVVEPGSEEKREGYDPLQEANDPRTGKFKPAEESSPEIGFRSKEEPHLEEESQRADRLNMKERLQGATNPKPTMNSSEIQPNAIEHSQENQLSANGPPQSNVLDPRIVDSREDNVPTENIPEQTKDLQDTTASSQEVELPKDQPESTVVKVLINFSHPPEKPPKGRKIRIPEIFIKDASQAKDINIPKPAPEVTVINTPKPAPEVTVPKELSPGEARNSDVDDSIPEASVHNALPTGGSEAVHAPDSIPKVSVFNELPQDEPWWLGPPTPMVYGSEVKSQDKPWPLGPSITKPPVNSENTSNRNKMLAKAHARRQEPTNNGVQGRSRVRRRKLYVRKARNAAARRILLEIALGRQLASQTKPALRRLANGETITPDSQS